MMTFKVRRLMLYIIPFPEQCAREIRKPSVLYIFLYFCTDGCHLSFVSRDIKNSNAMTASQTVVFAERRIIEITSILPKIM